MKLAADFRQAAREALRGKWPIAILIGLVAVLLGGASIPVELTERARKQGIRSFCGYGLTEFASTVCAKEADGAADVGEALPGREVKIVAGDLAAGVEYGRRLLAGWSIVVINQQ